MQFRRASASALVVAFLSSGALLAGGRTASVAGVASGAWAAEAAVVQPLFGRWFDQGHYDWIFWAVALIPMVGVLLWLPLSKNSEKTA